ncbi:MAG: CDP-alcohol phosphatidyltransferase family protein [Bacteroidia bacterium]|nr:CDP-alcohol phosphatidyltransferase family protein [Bacteroidia bacterium]
MPERMKQLPNIISASRGFAAIGLLCTPTFSAAFWIPYVWGGVSDMIDGSMARKLGAESMAGAVIDSIADLTFVAAALIKVLPMLEITGWLWVWIAFIAAIRLSNIVLGYVRQKRFIPLHTFANRVTGLFLFLLPAAVLFLDPGIVIFIACIVATFASVQEGFKILK